MRRRVYWMTSLDEAILEFFYGLDSDDPVALPPKPVWYNLVELRRASDKSHTTVARRMKKLASADLLVRDEETGYYTIADLAIDYLEGDLSDDAHSDLQSAFEE